MAAHGQPLADGLPDFQVIQVHFRGQEMPCLLLAHAQKLVRPLGVPVNRPVVFHPVLHQISHHVHQLQLDGHFHLWMHGIPPQIFHHPPGGVQIL